MPASSKAALALAKEIRRHRRAAGLTQQDIAARIGVSGAQFHRYETGATRISTSGLIAIADALNIRAETLLATASAAEVEPFPVSTNSSQEIVDLVQMFGNILDPRHRGALVAVARMMSAAPQQRVHTENAVGAHEAADMLAAGGLKLAA
jgi:transcriptional regulator with XRE-family HTH domain